MGACPRVAGAVYRFLSGIWGSACSPTRRRGPFAGRSLSASIRSGRARPVAGNRSGSRRPDGCRSRETHPSEERRAVTGSRAAVDGAGLERALADLPLLQQPVVGAVLEQLVQRQLDGLGQGAAVLADRDAVRRGL